ncbi:MAG: hypothetical protein RR957_03480, partial [Oscillospiraceae bacterium]
MNKKLIAILCIFVVTLSVFSVGFAENTGTQNITKNALVTSNIPTNDDAKSLKNIADGDYKTPIILDGTQKAKFPYYVEFDFGTYVAEISDLRIHTIMGKDMGIKNIDVECFENGFWKKVKSGL